MWLAKARGSSIRSTWNCSVGLGVGWWHHGLLIMRCLLRIVCTILVVFMDDTTENVWTDVYKEVADLLAPLPNKLSQMGPKSHPLETSHVGDTLGKPVFKPSSPGYVPNNVPVRAEGCGVGPRPPREFTLVDEKLRLSSSKNCAKRSWMRAIRRALVYGKVRYHGCWFRLKHFSKEDILHAQRRQTTSSRPSPRKAVPTTIPAVRRLNYLSVNLGGLPSSRFDELLAYGFSQQIHVIVVSETRRKSTMFWESSHYKIIQSGEGDGAGKNSYAGLLVAVQGPFLVSYAEIVPGRLIHVRLSSDRSSSTSPPLNLIACYNKVLASQGSLDDVAAAAAVEVRSHLWCKLDSVLQSLPRRQGVLLVGDLNCHVQRYPPYVATADPSNDASVDEGDLLATLERHDLRVHNTGSRRRAITFSRSVHSPPISGSRPDFVIIRASMRRWASQVRVQWSLPFCIPSEAGWHAALTGSLDLKWTCWRKGAPCLQRPARLDQHKLRAALSPDHPLHVEFLSSLESSLSSPSPIQLDKIEALSSVVMMCGQKTFGAMRTQRRPPPWATESVMKSCAIKWECFKALRRLKLPHTLFDYFRCWLTAVKSMLASRKHKKLSNKARQDWVHEVCAQAQAASDKRHHDFFKYVHMLAPRKRRDIPGLSRKLSGTTTLREEREKFIEHFSLLFQSPASSQVPIPNVWQWSSSSPTCADLDGVFSKMPLFKAVPFGHALGALWRVALGSDSVRSRVDEVLRELPDTGVPSQFRNGSLRLLFKPGKKGDEVSHYRPLVLQCPLGKSILRWVAMSLFTFLRPLLLQHPQFAYLPGRSAEMAVHRVSSFLCWRKSVAGYVQIPASWRMSGWQQPPCSGCMVVSLDLTQAFDLVDRQRLFGYLAALEVPIDLQNIIRAWHHCPEYSLAFGDEIHKIITGRGVRQGCTLAPLLWLIYLYSIIEELRMQFPGTNWLHLLTCYADDLILCIPIDSADGATQALETVVNFLDFIRSKGLIINLTKTQFFLKLVGKDSF